MRRLCGLCVLMMGFIAFTSCGDRPERPFAFEQPGMDLASSAPSGVTPDETEAQRLLAPETPEPLAPTAADPQPIPPAPAEPGPQPIPPAPAQPGEVPAQVAPGMDAETVISHDATGPAGAEAVVQGTSVRPGQAGAVASSMPAGARTEATDIVTAPALGPQNVDVPWVLYRHPAFGFTLRLPGHWTEWQPPSPVFAQVPALAHIGFHDRDMVAAGTAELEPLRLLISVYANPSQQQAPAWLEVNGLLTGDEAVEPLTVADRPAVRVCSRRLIAPACAVYIAHKGFVYRFLVVSEAESSILAGLSFEP